MMKFSLLELLHPDGRATTFFVLGSHCPENFISEPQMESDQKVALIVLAPSVKECRSKDWLEGAAEWVGHWLSDDGVCYVFAPVPWRLKIIRLLSKAGLVIDGSFWHFPDWASSHYLIPLQHGPSWFAIETIVTAPSWKRTLAREIFRYSGVRGILGTFWKSAGISVRRPGARPLFQWLFKREHPELLPGTAIIRRSWRELHGASILYCFSESDSLPSAIAKVTYIENASTCREREAEALEVLGPSARSAGVQVPQILLKEHNSHHSSLFISPIQGRPASDRLDSNPNLLLPILAKVVGWLERWHLATIVSRHLQREHLEQALLAPVELLSPFLQSADQYRDWLAHQIQAAAGDPMPFVAAHNDLTMANILLDEHDIIGVVDWETGQAEGWPLVDFHYALTDAVRIAEARLDWLRAFKACYLPQGSFAPKAAAWQAQLQTATGISPRLAELCFHACWLHHASNEHRVSQPDTSRPFLQIVQWLALHCSNTHD